MISSPDDDEFQPLDTGAEKERVEGALRALIEANLVELAWLPHATLGALQRAIDHGGDFHVFHYIGDGEYDERSREGTLVLERENWACRPGDRRTPGRTRRRANASAGGSQRLRGSDDGAR